MNIDQIEKTVHFEIRRQVSDSDSPDVGGQHVTVAFVSTT